MATRLGTVDHGRFVTFVIQGLGITHSQPALSLQVTPLAPSGATTHGAVVIHGLGTPSTGAGVAGLAIHGCAVQQLNFRDVIAWLGKRTALQCPLR